MTSTIRLFACCTLASLLAFPAVAYMATAAIGYNWFFPENIADLRIELEGGYRFNDTDSLNNLPLDGEVETFSAMVNGYFDFRTTWPVVPYLGLGFGAARGDVRG